LYSIYIFLFQLFLLLFYIWGLYCNWNCCLAVTVTKIYDDDVVTDQTMGQRVMGHWSWVKLVNECQWITWVTGLYRKTLDPW